MSTVTETLLQQVLSLDEADRAFVGGLLIESLDSRTDPGVEAAWDAEIQRRVAELDAGTAQTVPWSEVRRRLFRDLE